VTDLLRAGSLAVFIGLGLWAAAARDESRRRRAASVLIGYVLLVFAAVAATGRDDWPFSAYRLYAKHYDPTDVYSRIEARVVDDAGREWPIDPYAGSPLPHIVVSMVLDGRLRDLDDRGRDRVAAFLLERAEAVRQRRAEGRRATGEGRLGPLSAPHGILPWLFDRAPPEGLARPYRTIRFYRARWRGVDRWLGRPRELTLVFEHSRPPGATP
jgi:hypothetical protein